MKAITLWQPWASLMALGVKAVETRSWSTDHRGPLAIHAGLAWPQANRDFALSPFVRDALEMFGVADDDPYRAWPRGVVLCTVELTDVVGTGWDALAKALRARPVVELGLGDFGPGRFAWLTRDVRRVEPAWAVGQRGLWEYDEGGLMQPRLREPVGRADPTVRHPEGYREP